MKVYLATAYPTEWTYMPRFHSLANQDRFKQHNLTGDPADADIMLFVDARHEHNDWRLTTLQNHNLVKRYREKVFIYNEMDQPWCALPGLYVSMPKSSFDPQRQRACNYVIDLNPYIHDGESREPDLLFSFMGRRCHETRDAILRFQHPRALIQDTTNWNFFGTSGPEFDCQKQQYAEVLQRSKFVLCPRGAGPSSFRLFETMASGRVPVIISDEWVPPIGPDWKKCAIRIREKDVHTIPDVLSLREADFELFAHAAHNEWQEWFGPEVLFHRMVEDCRSLMENRHQPEAYSRWLPNKRLIHLGLREMKSKIVTVMQKRKKTTL